MRTVFPTAAVLLFGIGAANAGVTLPCTIGSGMVLQQKTQAPLWGWTEPGESVQVEASWSDRPVTATAGQNGKWLVRLATPAAGGPHTITIRAGNTVVLEDVLVGEVWLASGQSNMEWALVHTDDAEAEVAAATHPEIRLFSVERSASLSPQSVCVGKWAACSPETAGGFSAVAYYFGHELQRELGVPVGLIKSAWGGTVAEAWTPRSALEGPEAFAPIVERLEQTIAAEQAGESAEEPLPERIRDWWQRVTPIDAVVQAHRQAWMQPEFDVSSWETMDLPGNWETRGLVGFDGCVWFRRTVAIPDAWAGKELTLELGPIDDVDLAWFDDRRIGQTIQLGRWMKPRRYAVDGALVTAGTHALTVRVLDTGGEGGFRGGPEQLRLAPTGDERAALSLAGPWHWARGFALADAPAYPEPSKGLDQNTPTALYNAMIAPLVPHAIRGAIWYQGESNAGRAYQYRTLFPAMIESWRRAWGQGAFPFFYVQIAPYNYGNNPAAAELREAQMMALSVRNTGMAVTMDIGNPDDIHPSNKRDVGRRLALMALAKTYDREGIVYSGPLYRKMRVEGDRIRLHFDYVGGGLVAQGGPLSHFTVAGEDRQFHPATAAIDKDTVVVRSDAVPRPVAVRYGWGSADMPNLFNAAGLPASSFRTDNWPGVTADAR